MQRLVYCELMQSRRGCLLFRCRTLRGSVVIKELTPVVCRVGVVGRSIRIGFVVLFVFGSGRLGFGRTCCELLYPPLVELRGLGGERRHLLQQRKQIFGHVGVLCLRICSEQTPATSSGLHSRCVWNFTYEASRRKNQRMSSHSLNHVSMKSSRTSGSSLPLDEASPSSFLFFAFDVALGDAGHNRRPLTT